MEREGAGWFRAGLPAMTSRGTPLRGLVISAACLVAAGGVAALRPDWMKEAASLVWLLALVPPFLLSYYRGWVGSALALVLGMVVLVLAEVGAGLWLRGHVDWWVAAAAGSSILLVSAGTGLVTERLKPEEEGPEEARGREPVPAWQRAAHLERGLEEDQFELHYQPMVDLASRRVVGVEALVRWKHPEAGLLPPGVFLPHVFEEGLGLRLGAWVIDRAVGDAASLQDAFQQEQLVVSLNLSAPQCTEPDRVEGAVVEALERHGVEGSSVRFEVAEQARFAALPVIDRLNELGSSVVIEGSGFHRGSLGQLDALDIVGVKVAPELTGRLTEEEARRALHRTISRAHRNDFLVTVSGIETEAQLRLLRRLEADLAQGFLFMRPQPLTELRTRQRIRWRLEAIFDRAGD